MTERHSHPQQALLRQQGWVGVHLGRGVQADALWEHGAWRGPQPVGLGGCPSQTGDAPPVRGECSGTPPHMCQTPCLGRKTQG